MARDIWVISDTHLLHSNMLNFKDGDGNRIRGDLFSTQKECDDFILSNWNDKVKPGDLVYHLGDVFIGKKEEFASLWPKFNGSKRLVVGNHDDIKYLSSGGFFQKVLCWRVWPEYDLTMTHVPIQLDNSYDGLRTTFNVHGHIHHNPPPTSRHFNVCVENIGYTPVHIEDLAALLGQKKKELQYLDY